MRADVVSVMVGVHASLLIVFIAVYIGGMGGLLFFVDVFLFLVIVAEVNELNRRRKNAKSSVKTTRRTSSKN